MITAIDKRINSILVKRGLLTKEKSDEAMEIAGKEMRSFIDVLIDKESVDEGVLLGSLAREVSIPPISVEKIQPDEKTIQSFNEEWANYYTVLPVARLGKTLTLAVANPFDVVKFDDIRMLTNCNIKLVLCLERRLREAIKRAYNPEEQKMEELLEDAVGPELELTESDVDEKIDLSEISGESGDSPAIKVINMLIYRALHEGASDIHIEPYEKKVRVRFRQDGVLHEVFFPPRRLHNALISRIKIMSGLDISERRIPQDGKFQIKYEGRRIDFRVGISPTINGERAMLRLLDSSTLTLTLKDLGFEPESLAAFERAVNASYGMVLVTGPTGCGKTTTLYCAIKGVFSEEDNLITVEDPVEYQLAGVIQVPVNVKQGMTFGAALRSILRQDPDTIMIGEMRDLETADIAVKAAITGHLVFSTLHTNDAVSTVTRLVDMGIDPFMVSSAVLLVANQRLVRRLCEHCKAPINIPKQRLISVGFKPEEAENAKLYRPIGCARCLNGFKGRFALYEVLEIDDEIRRMIIKGASILEIKEYATTQRGMVTLRRAGILSVLRGQTALDEVLRTTS